MSLNNNNHVVAVDAATTLRRAFYAFSPQERAARLVAEADGSTVGAQSFDYLDDLDELVWRRGGSISGLVVA